MKIIINIDEHKIIDKIRDEIDDNDVIGTVKDAVTEAINDDVLDGIDFDDCITVENVAVENKSRTRPFRRRFNKNANDGNKLK